MAYLTNEDFSTLSRIWCEARERNGFLTFDNMYDFGAVLRKINEDKEKSRERTRKAVAEKRKFDKNYARKKKQ